MLKVYDDCPKCNMLLLPEEIKENKCCICDYVLNQVKGETKTMLKNPETISVVLPNGAKVEGSVKAVQEVMRNHGMFVADGVYYNSKHLGTIKISEMTTRHLMNAIRKMYRAWIDSLDTEKMPLNDFRSALRTGPRDITLLALVNELNKRVR